MGYVVLRQKRTYVLKIIYLDAVRVDLQHCKSHFERELSTPPLWIVPNLDSEDRILQPSPLSRGELFCVGVKILRRVSDHLQTPQHGGAGGKVAPLEIAPLVHGRVGQAVRRHGVLVHGTRGCAAVTLIGFQRAGRLPAAGLRDRCCELNLARVASGGIQHYGVPLKIEHVRCNHHATLRAIGGRQLVVFSGDGLHAFGNVR